jgi:glycosyltransferase involved in cell wall biosynthesis
VLLEALALGVPALANADCEPLADHLAASGAGEAYRGARTLRRGLLRALARPAAERQRLGEAGRRYVDAHYAPQIVERAWLDAVDRVAT